MIEKVRDKIEDFVWGKKTHNLQIDIEKICAAERKQQDLEKIAEYTGSFIVTERGYLLRGSNNKFSKKYATILDTETNLPPAITYENGYSDQIIRDILGLRLASLANAAIYEKQPQLNSSLSFA